MGIALLLSYVPYRIVARPGEKKLQKMSAELARVQADIENTQADVAERRAFVQALKNDTRTIESIARKNLHMLYPHEKTLRLSSGFSEGAQ